MMRSLWHESILGAYSPKDGYINLNYRNLFLDPVKAELTLFHEQTHRFLTKMTDFGQATSVIFQASEALTKLAPHDLERIKKSLFENQVVVQESTATLIEAIHLERIKGREAVLSWVKGSLPIQYRERLNEVMFVLDLQREEQDRFTGTIPIYALHTIIRKRVVELDLMRDSGRFIGHVTEPDNNPDNRFRKLVSAVRQSSALLGKTPEEICKAAGVSFHQDLSKDVCAEFMTYLAQFTDQPRVYLPADIGDAPEAIEHLLSASDEMIIGGFSLKQSMCLTAVADLLHYQDVTEAIVVFGLGAGSAWQLEYEKLVGVRPEGVIIAFSKTGEKYHLPLDKVAISTLLSKAFEKKTLIVKWGLYEVGGSCLSGFTGSRRPNVVLYNTVNNLTEKFEGWFKAGRNVEYLFLGASEDHPFHTLILKDENGVLHYVNVFGKKLINDFRMAFKDNLVSRPEEDFLSEPMHLNNVLSIWMGLPWEIDWYKSMFSGRKPGGEFVYRK